MSIGLRIKKAIESSQLTPDQVAAHAEMSTTNLYKIFKRDSIDSKYLVKISQVLNLPVSFFLDEEEQEPNTIRQSGFGNQAGNYNKQQVMNGGQAPAKYWEAINEDLYGLLSKHKLCEAERDSLKREIALKDELLEARNELINQLKSQLK